MGNKSFLVVNSWKCLEHNLTWPTKQIGVLISALSQFELSPSCTTVSCIPFLSLVLCKLSQTSSRASRLVSSLHLALPKSLLQHLLVLTGLEVMIQWKLAVSRLLTEQFPCTSFWGIVSCKPRRFSSSSNCFVTRSHLALSNTFLRHPLIPARLWVMEPLSSSVRRARSWIHPPFQSRVQKINFGHGRPSSETRRRVASTRRGCTMLALVKAPRTAASLPCCSFPLPPCFLLHRASSDRRSTSGHHRKIPRIHAPSSDSS
jgi:hypothetical protein